MSNRPLRTLLTVVAATLMLAGLVACGTEEEPRVEISPAEANSAVSSSVQANVGGVASASSFLSESNLACDMLEMFDGFIGVGVGDTAIAIDENGDPIEPVPVEEEPFDCAAAFDLSTLAADLDTMLSEKVFIEANIESSTKTAVTYRLDPNTVCATDDGTDSSGCTEMLGTMPVRFVVYSTDGANYDVDVRLGEPAVTVGELEFYEDHIAIEADLGRMLDAFEKMARTEQPDFEIPGDVEGRVRLALERHAEADYSLSASIVEAIHIDVQPNPESDDRVVVDIGRAEPAMSLRFDGTNKEIMASVDWNAIDVSLPGDLFGGSVTVSCDSTGNCIEEEDPGFQGALDLHLDGSSATMLLSALSDSIELTNVGLGDGQSTLDIDGQRVLTFSAGKFDATLVSSEDGDVRVTVRPSLSYVAEFAFAAVADQFDELDSWMLDESLSVSLEGDGAPVLELGSEVEVVSGTLTLSSKTHGAVTVGAGQCLLDGIGEDPADHPFGQISAGECGQVQEPTPVPEPAP